MESIARIATVQTTGDNNLVCPRCGAAMLHHIATSIFERKEDAATLTLTQVQAGKTTVETIPSVGSGNPSGRRHGLAIRFRCEGCGGDGEGELIELTLAQHKGNTITEWHFTPRE